MGIHVVMFTKHPQVIGTCAAGAIGNRVQVMHLQQMLLGSRTAGVFAVLPAPAQGFFTQVAVAFTGEVRAQNQRAFGYAVPIHQETTGNGLA